MKKQDGFRNVVQVDIDTNRTPPVYLGKPKEFSRSEEHYAQEVIDDMATLCEGICTLIHVAEKYNIKPSADSLRDCIKHITDGFADASYKGTSFDDFKKESESKE